MEAPGDKGLEGWRWDTPGMTLMSKAPQLVLDAVAAAAAAAAAEVGVAPPPIVPVVMVELALLAEAKSAESESVKPLVVEGEVKGAVAAVVVAGYPVM